MIRRGIGALLALPLLFGCAVGNRWGSPRAIPAGTLAHVITADVSAVNWDPINGTRSGFSFIPLPSATYTLRAGLWDSGELGAGLGYLGGINADLKLELLRSHWFDFAVAPGIGVLPWNSFIEEDPSTTWIGSLPLLFRINASESISVLPSVVPQFVRINGKQEKSSQMVWSGNLAVQFRANDWIAWQPAINGFYGDGITAFGLGMGVVLGSQPGY